MDIDVRLAFDGEMTTEGHSVFLMAMGGDERVTLAVDNQPVVTIGADGKAKLRGEAYREARQEAAEELAAYLGIFPQDGGAVAAQAVRRYLVAHPDGPPDG